jgi:Kef-type K+ transport system membrane component KefB
MTSLVVGVVVGLTIASLIGIPQLAGSWSIPKLVANAFSFWGILFGGFAAVISAGMTYALLNRRDRTRSRWGRIVAGLALALLAAATVLWIVAWGFSPFTLEGMWIYPVEVTTAVGWFLLLRPQRAGSLWDEPRA